MGEEEENGDDENQRNRRDLSRQLFPKSSAIFRLLRQHTLRKRSTNTTQIEPDVFPDNTEDPSKPKSTNEDTASRMDPTNKYYEYFFTEVNTSVHTFTLSQLKHYTYYSISVKACREGKGDSCGEHSFSCSLH